MPKLINNFNTFQSDTVSAWYLTLIFGVLSIRYFLVIVLNCISTSQGKNMYRIKVQFNKQNKANKWVGESLGCC